ncbi:MAG: CRTAC1 family protein [Armatimonadota bacterium]
MRGPAFAFVFSLSTLILAGCVGEQSGRASAKTPDEPFVDVTAAAGIDYQLTPAKRPMRILESVGSGCGFVDLNGDGKLDVLLVGQPRCAVYRNDGGGRFTDITAETGLGVEGPWITAAVADYDRDGDIDVLLAGYRRSALFRNDGGRFTDVTAEAGVQVGRWCNTAAFADFDRDGYPDLYIGTYVKFGPESKQYCRLHAGGAHTSCRPVDYDGDVGACFRNRGDGTFEDVTQKWGLDKVHGKNLGIAVADYDDDGWPDLFLANDEMAQELYRNQEGKGFVNVAIETGSAYRGDGGMMGGMGVDWGDYDNDGALDLLVGTYEAEPKALFRNLGGSGFEWATARSQIEAASNVSVVWGTLLFDYDNDGLLDIAFANGHVFDNVEAVNPQSSYRQPTQLFRNQGDGSFSFIESPTLAVPMAARGLACGDYDGDGDLDLLISDIDGKARLLENRAGNGKHWLLVQTRGTKSNRDGLGARVTLHLKGGKRVGEVRTARSYATVCDGRVHFGLGDVTEIERVEVRWPSGAVSRVDNVRANQVLVVEE